MVVRTYTCNMQTQHIAAYCVLVAETHSYTSTHPRAYTPTPLHTTTHLHTPTHTYTHLHTSTHTHLLLHTQDFLRNSRGINEGSDLDETYMCELYDRIVNNEIKLKDDFMSGQQAQQATAGQPRDAGLFSALMGLIPGGRKQQTVSEPSDDAIKRTHDFLRCVFFIGLFVC